MKMKVTCTRMSMPKTRKTLLQGLMTMKFPVGMSGRRSQGGLHWSDQVRSVWPEA